MWRRRRWRELLVLIDRLPRNTYFAEAVANDEEHAKMLLELERRAGGQGQAAPRSRISSWSEEVAKLADLIDEIRLLRMTVIGVNSPKQAKAPDLYPRPRTALDKVRAQERQRKHEALVARVLPRPPQTSP